MMTKKDYEKLAHALNVAVRSENIDDYTIHFVIGAISEALYLDNPRFDQARFVAACKEGVE